MAHGKHNKKAQPYAQNPYGGTYAGTGQMTENRYDYMTNMPKQGFKSEEQLSQELQEEEEKKERKGKGKSLITARY